MKNLAERLQNVFEQAYEGNQPFATREENVNFILNNLNDAGYIELTLISLEEIRNEYNVDEDEINLLLLELRKIQEEKLGCGVKLSHGIVELFEQLLDEKGIEIPCEDETEQKDRHDGDNVAKLYGMEYWNLVDKIESLLSGATCRVRTSMGYAYGNISLGENGGLEVVSEHLDYYLEKYSME